ncbi:MAG: MBOAT family protein [Flavobacteriales bacterium]|nr:MBOAT family protein [Flavobacteriales bacterium]
MLFNSIHFLYFLPIVLLAYWLLKDQLRWILLLAASYYFYMSWEPIYGLLLMGSTLVDYWCGLQLASSKKDNIRKRWVTLSSITNLGVFFTYKYLAFFGNAALDAVSAVSDQQFDIIEAMILPIGISFYTFQSMSYTIDVYRKEVEMERHLGKFALFVSFFPQLVAGPVERFKNLMPQIHRDKSIDIETWIPAFRLILWGFFKKVVIADRLALFVDPIFADVSEFGAISHALAGVFFVVQVYCDFSGYSDIAIGTAKLFGFDLMLNWRRPLLSKSLVEFWQRNHISLTTWFREYLYISLGGSRCSKNRWLLNIFLVFIISSVWHGSNWTFMVWGLMHGVVYIMEITLFKNVKIPWLGWFYLFGFHTISLMAFRANSVSDLMLMYESICSFNIDIAQFKTDLLTINSFGLVLLVNVLLIAFLFTKELIEEHGIGSLNVKTSSVYRPTLYIALFVGIFVFGEFSENEFFYFQF